VVFADHHPPFEKSTLSFQNPRSITVEKLKCMSDDEKLRIAIDAKFFVD
jgi:hypothetical protein